MKYVIVGFLIFLIVLSLMIAHVISSPHWRNVFWSTNYPEGQSDLTYQDEIFKYVFGFYPALHSDVNDKEQTEFALKIRDDLLHRLKMKIKYWESGYGEYSNSPLDFKGKDWSVILQAEDDKMINCIYDYSGNFKGNKN